MSNVGLYLGTFNPIHNGHVTLAKYFSELPELDQVLVVISPQSPFKIEDTFINDIERLELAKTVFKNFKNVYQRVLSKTSKSIPIQKTTKICSNKTTKNYENLRIIHDTPISIRNTNIKKTKFS